MNAVPQTGARKTAVVICPGRGTYTKTELGTLGRIFTDRALLASFDAARAALNQEKLSDLDGAASYSLSRHTRGDNASALIYAATLADMRAIDATQIEVVAVTGNSMGWYSALACGGALTPDDGFTVVNTMGTLMQQALIGGQLIYPSIGEDWRPAPAAKARLLALVAEIAARPGHVLTLSIDLGGMLVLAGNEAGLAGFEASVPLLQGRFPMRLANHAAFHSKLQAPVAEQGRLQLAPGLFGQPALPLIDGRGAIWWPGATDTGALWDYTLGHQVTETYDFTRAVTIAAREFAPDLFIVTGPGATLGGVVAQSLILADWRGMKNKADFQSRQAAEPLLISMGIADQRRTVTKGETEMSHGSILKNAGFSTGELGGGSLTVRSPIDGAVIARVSETAPAEMPVVIASAQAAFKAWRQVPAPRRGELVRLLGEELRAAKAELGALVTLEVGKITSEGLGEVQEMIDICDFAVGLSRQIYGLTIASERPGHRMMETWHPMGPCGVISAFNFPVAVWSWNAALALVCGDPVIWKPSEKTPLTALATMRIMERALKRFGDAPSGLVQLVIGGPELGEALVGSAGVPIISATGSTRMGGIVGPKISARFGRSILELGGNNAMIVAPSADLDMAVRAIVFSAVGTAGQRCTSLRRLIVHHSIRVDLMAKLTAAYASLPIGDPRKARTLVGPLIDSNAGERMAKVLDAARAEGGTVHGGKRITDGVPEGGIYVSPALADMPGQTDTVRTETFAPILYVLGYDTLDDATALQNDVPQGLSSCIFTLNLREAETFLSAAGSDCGIANVNIGPSGAEIGGAFGGEKETGGGRESGSDAWKSYMRRQTATINFSTQLPLAQGVSFDF